MNEKTQTPLPKLTPDRKVVVWSFVQRCIEKAGPDSRARDASMLVKQQLREATDEGGKL